MRRRTTRQHRRRCGSGQQRSQRKPRTARSTHVCQTIDRDGTHLHSGVLSGLTCPPYCQPHLRKLLPCPHVPLRCPLWPVPRGFGCLTFCRSPTKKPMACSVVATTISCPPGAFPPTTAGSPGCTATANSTSG